jgi:hypothetical protein
MRAGQLSDDVLASWTGDQYLAPIELLVTVYRYNIESSGAATRRLRSHPNNACFVSHQIWLNLILLAHIVANTFSQIFKPIWIFVGTFRRCRPGIALL